MRRASDRTYPSPEISPRTKLPKSLFTYEFGSKILNSVTQDFNPNQLMDVKYTPSEQMSSDFYGMCNAIAELKTDNKHRQVREIIIRTYLITLKSVLKAFIRITENKETCWQWQTDFEKLTNEFFALFLSNLRYNLQKIEALYDHADGKSIKITAIYDNPDTKTLKKKKLIGDNTVVVEFSSDISPFIFQRLRIGIINKLMRLKRNIDKMEPQLITFLDEKHEAVFRDTLLKMRGWLEGNPGGVDPDLSALDIGTQLSKKQQQHNTLANSTAAASSEPTHHLRCHYANHPA